MTARKYVSFDEQAARKWHSRSHWKTLGILIAENAEPKGEGWMPVPRKSYPLFTEDQGTPISKQQKKAAAPAAEMPDLFTGVHP